MHPVFAIAIKQKYILPRSPRKTEKVITNSHLPHRHEPNSGLLITLFQFVFTVASTLHYQFSPSHPYFLRPSPVPWRKWALSASLFFTVNMLNNWAFAFDISVPVHIILRSFGSVTTMGAGWLRGKKYSVVQVLCVVVLTVGVCVSAWADAAAKVSPFHPYRLPAPSLLFSPISLINAYPLSLLLMSN
jgi:drug/metabolite transporter (DMT)-like permease